MQQAESALGMPPTTQEGKQITNVRDGWGLLIFRRGYMLLINEINCRASLLGGFPRSAAMQSKLVSGITMSVGSVSGGRVRRSDRRT